MAEYESSTGVRSGTRLDALLGRLLARERELWVVAILATLADAVLTYYGLQAGLHETNPVMQQAMAHLGTFGGIGAVKLVALVVLVVVWAGLSRRHRPLVPAACAVPYLAATLINAVGLLVVTAPL